MVEVGLSWDMVQGSPAVDLDASAVCFSSTGILKDAAFYNQLTACNGAIKHSGDCKRGEKEGFDETIQISLDEIKGINVIVFLVSAFSGGTLENCESAFCEIKHQSAVVATMSATCAQTGSSTALILCILFRHPDSLDWHFCEVRKPTAGRHFTACLLPIHSVVDQVLDPGCLLERNLSPDKTFQMEKGGNLSIPMHLNKFVVGLGWSTKASGIDLDASCVMLCDKDGDGDLDPVDVVYFGQKERPGVKSMGDNMTGAGDGDDEQIVIHLDHVEKHITALAIVVTIFSHNRSFKDVDDSYVRLLDPKTNHVYANYSLTGSLTKTGLIFCNLIRGKTSADGWSLLSIGEQCDGNSVRNVTTNLWDGCWDGVRREPTADSSAGITGATTATAEDCCCAIC